MKFDTNAILFFDEILKSGKKNRDGIFSFLLNPQNSSPLLKALANWPTIFDISSVFNYSRHKHFHLSEWFHDFKYNNEIVQRQIITKVIDLVINYKSEDIDAVFFDIYKAMTATEIRFVEKYIPQNSHEERLTGHLMSETIFSLDLIKPLIKKKLYSLYNEEICCDFYYADIATDGMEKYTGGDFAMIIEVNLPDVPTFVRAFKFQAKKATPSARIDLKQIEVFLTGNSEGSFYIFYNLNPKSMNSGRRPPLVVGAKDCLNQIRSEEGQKTATIHADWIHSSGTPFSAFIVLEAMQPDKRIGFQCNSLREAANFIYNVPYDRHKNNTDWFKQPSRLVVVTIGGSIPKHYAGPNSDEQNFLFRFPSIHE